MLTQEQLIIKLLWESKLSDEEKENIKKDSLALSFMANAIEEHLSIVKFLPNEAIEIRGPCVEDACIEFRQKKYVLPFIKFEFSRKKYIVHELGFRGEKRKKIYRKLLPALKHYINCISYYGSGYIDGLKIKT